MSAKYKVYTLLVFGLFLFSHCAQKPQNTTSTTQSQFMTLAGQKKIDGLSREQVEGQKIYRHYCAVCHGKTGQGDGFNAFNLKNSFGIQPANLQNAGQTLSQKEIEQIISGGGPILNKSKYMPPWRGTLNPVQIHAVVAYVQSLPSPQQDEETHSTD